MREPFSGVTTRTYLTLTDRQILDVYLAERAKDHSLIPYRKRHPAGGGLAGGHPDRAGRELPSAEELKIPPECLQAGPPLSWTLMFWQVWASRGLNTEAIAEKFWPIVRRHCKRRGSQVGS